MAMKPAAKGGGLTPADRQGQYEAIFAVELDIVFSSQSRPRANAQVFRS